MEELIQLLQTIGPMSLDLLKHLRATIKRTDYKKGTIILEKGQISNSIFYIRKGLVRSFYQLNDKEVSNWFMKEKDFCISVLSFLRQIPSSDTLIALEDTEAWGMTRGELEDTYWLHPEFNVHGRLLTGEYYCRSEERQMAVKRQKNKDKYEHLMATDPDLVHRVSNEQLASYLDVSDRTFGTIRNAYWAKRKKK